MKNKLAITLVTITLFAAAGASTASAQSLLNSMRIGACIDGRSDETDKLRDRIRRDPSPEEIFEHLVALERRRGLVLDARPFAINQSSGKLSFSGTTGRVTVVNLNPFVFRYTIAVMQEELVSSALADFLELLLPPTLRPSGRAESGSADKVGPTSGVIKNRLDLIAARLNTFDPKNCPNATDAGCQALVTLKGLFDKLATQIGNVKPVSTPEEFKTYQQNLFSLRNQEADAYSTCVAAGRLRDHLDKFFTKNTDLETLKKADEQLRAAEWIAQDLTELTEEYKNDNDLQGYVVRCGGFNCLKQFAEYAAEAATFLTPLRTELNALQEVAKQMEAMLEATKKMSTQEGLFARTFDIIKRYEFSEATVSITRTPLTKEESDNLARSGQPETGTPGKNPRPVIKSGSGTSGNAGAGGPNDDVNKETKEEEKGKDSSDDKNGNGGTENGGNALNPQSNQSIQIGRPRFLLSGGLVYSPMQRRTFKPVTGFTRDANGNPTGDGTDNVIGLEEDSPRRLLPMAILNTRLHSFSPASVYFSLGVTAKHDTNVDIEYLLGPSVSLLNERALFTFGGYLGKVQNLVPDVKVGDKIPDNIGDAALFTKRYSFKPGFSFSWVFSETTKRSEGQATGGGGSRRSSSQDPDLKNEIRIGGLRFNLALGLVYSSLEDQTYDEIVGFARDRQGNLTNGQNLTRIVGLTSDSNYRAIPMAMLHSRLLDFGSRSLYFTTGVSGRKIDNNIKIEYLLGASVNLYQRKLFLTFGTFAGKQQVLGGDFFPGAALEENQNITIHDRYVWKPAFGVSYDISRIFRRGSQ